MATQIVMDHTGDTRHDFSVDDAAAVAKAEERFKKLTGRGFTAAVRTGNGETFVIRSFNPADEETLFFPRVIGGWRWISAMRNLRRSLLELARRFRAWHQRIRLSKKIREARGLTLLHEWLGPVQKKQFDAARHFEVVGCHTGKRYSIHHGRAGNVCELDDQGRPVIGLCFVPEGALVAGDVMLAQKIALETNELTTLAVANKFPVRTGER
jgi:hypothetical protein